MQEFSKPLPERLVTVLPMIKSEARLVALWITEGRRIGMFRQGEPVTSSSLLKFQEDQRRNGWAYEAIIAWDDSLPLGYFDIRYKDARAEILGIFIEPQFRKRHLGRHLVRVAIAMLRDRGCRKVTMEIFAHNAPSLRMSASLGFKQVRSFMHPADPTKTVTMSRPVDPWPRLSKAMPRYSLLRGENFYFQHAAVAEALLDAFTRIPGVELVLGLGSLARGFGDKWSDLDMVVLGRGLSLDSFWGGELWLAGLSVDLFVVDLDSSPPDSWDLGRRQAYEESRVLFRKPEFRLKPLQKCLRLNPVERRWGIYDALFRIGWLGFAPRDWYMKPRYGYLWSLPPDEWILRGCTASAHITVDRVVDMLFQLLFLLNWQHVPDAKWRRFLVPGLELVPRSLLGKLEKIETLPRDASHFTERADLLISLVEASVTILSKQGILKGNLYRAFLKHCPDYDPKS